MKSTNPFQSFWWAGYECADHLNCFGNRVDLQTATAHLTLAQQDYARLKPLRITTVREGIRWSQVEKKPYQYDWSSVQTLLVAGQQQGIQQVWDLCHFGYPDDLTPLHPMFARRFAALSRAFVEFFKSQQPDETLIVIPINEVSFIAWLGGEAKGTVPYCSKQGWEVKYGLMRAYIEAIEAMRSIDPAIRILTSEPLVNIVPSFNPNFDSALAIEQHENQFQVLDILMGKLAPELGGHPTLVDIIGLNYYYTNQWVAGENYVLPWGDALPDSRWLPLHQLFAQVFKRYDRPIILTETSHPGEHRPEWIRMIAQECRAALKAALPLWGVCIYPIIDRPDWDFLDHWHHSGLWDTHADTPTARLLNEPYAKALIESKFYLEENFSFFS